MFSRRRRTLSDTIRDATDPNIRSLRAEISKRQEKVAELELELFDLRVSLAEFERELEARVRPLERQLTELQAELNKARRQAERRAQWGERADLEDTPDVIEQFERTWQPPPRGRPGKPPRSQPMTPN
jgi:predicted  nucleic acid-binding Zn-ribbon protein